jgi:glycosyltransferase involved in cell wall biosynthesis
VQDNWVSKIAKMLYKLALKSTLQVWFLNHDDKQVFLEHKLVKEPKTFVLNGEGIDCTRFQIWSNQKIAPPIFLLIARMLWDKGVGDFVEAARLIKQKQPTAKFQLLGFLGADNPAAISDEQMDEWTKEGIVDYLGATDDVVPYIHAATCIVLPSYREGIPFTLLEASACGKPIITTNAVGCKETVDESITGFLCEVKNPISLANCMEKVIQLSNEQYAQMGRAGRAKVEREFDVQLITNHYLEVLTNFFSK